ncbi:MAG: type I phosphomannose isomerase catalytic subunit [Pirellulales bacterium]|nr:type I phosphomannose isomerase catalytic subunit [Pirellulales bacterium]
MSPIFRRYLWGGRRLGELFHKPIGPESDYAESWEIADRGPDQSRVFAGPWQGATLAELMRDHRRDLLGDQWSGGNFPLLVKLLDAQADLSVQVHPNDEHAARLQLNDAGKTEAWYVVAARPGSKIYAGLKPGFDSAALEREITRGACELCLHSFEPQAGDIVHLPAGTVHALGAGIVVAEVQQSSDVTYRLFDWNRVGADGRPRQLHLEQALQVIDYATGPVQPLRQDSTQKNATAGGCQQLLANAYFHLAQRQFDQPVEFAAAGRCRIWVVLAGALQIAGDPSPTPTLPGHTILFPASWPVIQAVPLSPVTLLEITLPVSSA